jgi:hypothetical protein
MKLKAVATAALVSLVLGAFLAPGIADAKKKKPKKAPTGPVVVGTDGTGDWGASVDPNLGPIGDALGMDLVEAVIAPGETGTINFIIKVNSLPPSGGTPEFARYIWSMFVDGEGVELDGKFTNYSRGVCDPTSAQCPPPRDPGQQPFFVRGNCGTVEGTNVETCEELGIVQATFDSAEGTITIPVPLELLGAKNGSKITGGTGIFGGSVEAAHSAFLSSGNGPSDGLIILETYVVSAKK